MKRAITLLYLIIFNVALVSAKVTLPSVFSNGMVLQQQSNVAIWGTSTTAQTVQIVTSWDAQTYIVNVATDGSWKTNVTTPVAGGPYTITVSDTELLTLTDVLIGEVWFASGQSNMEMLLKGRSASEPVLNSAQAIQNSENDNIRLFKSAKLAWGQASDNLAGQWEKASPSTVDTWSAIAYFYAKNLHEKLNVPVGILQVVYGGTPIQAWMSAGSLQAFPEVILPAVSNAAIADKTTPTGLFNSMINPMLGYGIKGVIWYQGEQNRGEPELFAKLFPVMIDDWRQRWGIGEFAFHYVQIAPYGSPTSYVPFIPFLREAQLKTLDQTTNTEMAVIVDKGSPTTNHPPDKEIVAERLSAIAFAKTYGFVNQKYLGPVYKSITIQGDKAILNFDNAESGLKFTSGESINFEIAGSNKVFYPGNGVINNNTIEVTSNSVPYPMAVRYAFKAWVVGDLFNEDGFPASSFRTDDWIDNQPAPSAASSIAGWEFSAYYPAAVNAMPGAKEATSKDDNLAVASLSRGDETSATSINFGYTFTTKSKAPNNSKQDALINKDYFLINLKPSEGYNVSLTKLNYKLRRDGNNGPVSYIWSFKAKDMSDFVEIGVADTLEYVSLGVQKVPLDLTDIPELQEVSSSDEIVFRLLVWGATSASNTNIAIGRTTSVSDKSLVLSFEGQVSKTLLAGWEFSEHNTANNVIAGAKEAIIKDESIAIASLSRGDETSRSELNYAYSFTAKSISPNNTKADALTNKDYFLVNIKPNEGYNVALKKLNYKLRRDNNNGPKKVVWSYKTSTMTNFVDIGLEQSLDFNTYGVLMDPLDLTTIPALQNISSTDSVIFRLLVWDASATGNPNIAIGRVATGDDKSLVLFFEGESIRTLPVELVSFTAQNNQSSVTLKWKTLFEQNNSHFDILRSDEGDNFKFIGSKKGAGNSSAIINYNFTDYSPFKGTAYYKLKQVDYNGNFKLYDPIAVKNNISNSGLQLFVAENRIVVNTNEEEDNNAIISVYDVSGRKYVNEKVHLLKGQNQFEIAVHSLKPGVYVVNVKTDKQSKSLKFIR